MVFARQLARWALGCAIACVVPLAIWSGGCGGNTVVQADAAAETGPADSGGDDGLVDATSPDMVSVGECCSMSESNQIRCSSDGKTTEICNDFYNGAQCGGNVDAAYGYGYVWRAAATCSNGCSPSSSGGNATCNP